MKKRGVGDPVAFVAQRGFMEVLFGLENGHKGFNDLKTLGLAPNTVLSRLRQAQRLGLVENRLDTKRASRARITYALTPRGRQFVGRFASVKGRFMRLQTELESLEKNRRTTENHMKFLLSSVFRRSV
jgi:DNA-binding HxlR family transcriptional regulator